MNLPFSDHEIADERTGLSLIAPNERYLESYRKVCEETWGKVHHDYILHDPAKFETWKDTIFDKYDDDSEGRNLPEGYLPSVTLWAIRDEDDVLVGVINVRLGVNDALITYGGTYGYFVTASERGKGYGIALGLMGLEATRRLGVDTILITVTEANKASMALSEHLPYTRKERDVVEAEGAVQPAWRFWFD